VYPSNTISRKIRCANLPEVWQTSEVFGQNIYLEYYTTVGNLVGCDDDSTSPITTAPEFFPQSVASGDPKINSVVLWTRVHDSVMSASDVPLQLQACRANQNRTGC
jgi:hypothetical protein